jgi:parvulin-like peptidyl-prolyl isomerase
LLALPAHAAPERRVVNRIVAIVDYEVITQRDVDRRMVTGQPRTAIIEALVDSALLVAEADRRQLSVERAEIDEALNEIAKSNNVTVAQIFAEAAKHGFDEPTYRAEIRNQMLDIRVTGAYVADTVARGGAPPADGLDGARKRLLLELRASAFVEVRP